MISGRLSDRLGRRKPVIIIAVVLFSCLSASSGLVTGFAALLPVRALMELAEDAVLPASQSPHGGGVTGAPARAEHGPAPGVPAGLGVVQVVEAVQQAGEHEVEGTQAEDGERVAGVDDEGVVADCEDGRDAVDGEDQVGGLDRGDTTASRGAAIA